MPHSPSSWIACELGLIRAVETDTGVRVLVGKQRQDSPGVGLAERLLGALGGEAEPGVGERLAQLIEAARRGERGALQVDVSRQSWRVIAAPLDGERVEVLAAPAEMALLSEMQRRAALSDMAAAVSHEVSNALSAISGWVELLQQAPGSPAEQSEILARVGRCASTAQGIARRLLDLVRDGDVGAREDVDVGALAEEVGDLLKLSARSERIELEVAVNGHARVRGVKVDLFSALWNLVKNAIEACAAGDHVRLHVAAGGDEVKVTVEDDGPGMDATTLNRVFTPYFTTKGAGTGLGMALVQRATEAFGGSVTVDSAPGRGTRVLLRLPRAGRHSDTYSPVSLRAPRAAAEAPQLAGVRVLVVDDDAALRDMVVTALQLKGAEVTACSNAAEANALANNHDIALIDMMLSDGRGDELLASLRRRGKVGAAMLVTGVVQRPRMVPGGEPDDWVRKPFELGPLTDRIRQTLERHRMLTEAASAVRPG